MEQQILQELESAAKIILAPPSLINNHQRAEAEAVFLNFRRTKSPYQICKFIFENSTIDYVIFETSNALKEAILREWNYMEADDINSIRNYLLNYILNHINVALFVREKILQVIAIIVKRGSFSDDGAERGKILGEVEKLIMCGELRKQVLGCSIICALMQEYASTVKSAYVGLPWEAHLAAKKQFEYTDLKKIFQLCVTSLNEMCAIEGPYTENALTFIKSLLQIAEGTLMWAFISGTISRRIFCIFERSHESDSTMSLKLNSHWKDLILAPSLFQLFFHLHWKIRNNAHLTHYTLNCLVQLASLNGPVLTSKNVHIEYIKNYLHYFLSFLSSVEIVDRESVGVSNIFLKLLIFNDFVIISDLRHEQFVTNFFQQMARLTCYFAENASRQDSMNYDESMFTEAFDIMLKAWNCLFRDNTSEAILKEASKCIFDSYLRWHLSPPYGLRTKVSTEEVVDAEEEEDLNKFESQLQAIGIFSRQVMNHTLPTLARLIDEKTCELKLMWQGTSNNNIQRDDLYEDLHWLVMIAGHVLTKERHGGDNLIPESIIKYSMERQQNVNISNSLALLASIDCSITMTDFSRLEESTDHVIWLVSSIFRLSELEKQMGEAKLSHVLSPTLTSTIAWFLQNWSRYYLWLNETSYTEISFPLVSAFGKETDCAKWIIDFILNKVQSNLCQFGTDSSVSENTCKLLLILVSSKDKASFLLKNLYFWNIINNGLRSSNRFVSPDIKKWLMKSFAIAVTAFDGPEEKRKEYLAQILTPVIDRFRGIVTEENFKKQYHDEIVRGEIMEIINVLLGLVLGVGVLTESVASSKCLYEHLNSILVDMVSLLSIYHNYQQIGERILELFLECSKSLITVLSANDVRSFHESCLRLVDGYVKNNSGRLTDEVNAEEESFHDMLVFIDLLTNLIMRNVVDLVSNEENGGIMLDPSGLTAITVTMHGLSGILPLMSVETLKFPDLCSRFYSLLELICDIHAEKLCSQSQEFLVNILALVELGLTAFGPDITTLCCKFIQFFSRYLCRHAAILQPEKFLLLQPFLKIMMTIILSRQINFENERVFGCTFHSLICCYKDFYLRLVEELISSQTETEIAQRLSKAFTELMADLYLEDGRRDKLTFEKNFERFIINIQGFLFVK